MSMASGQSWQPWLIQLQEHKRDIKIKMIHGLVFKWIFQNIIEQKSDT